MDSNNFLKSSAPLSNIQNQDNSMKNEPSLNKKFKSVVEKKINNKIFSQEEKIYPNENEENAKNLTVKQKKCKN